MPLKLSSYKDIDIIVEKDTEGGDTYHLNDKVVCFNYVKSHYRAVRLLTQGESKDHAAIKDSVVSDLVATGQVVVDVSDCIDNFGWLGCRVWDGEGDFVGTLGVRCSFIAGFKTDHVGTGRCYLHGGVQGIKRMTDTSGHGLTAKKTRVRVLDKIQRYLDDPDPLNLGRELATQRALLDEILMHVLDSGDEVDLMSRAPELIKLSDLIGRQVDRIVTIEQKYALTASQVFYVQSVVVDVLSKYVTDPLLKEKAATELVERLGTGDRAVTVIAPRILEGAFNRK